MTTIEILKHARALIYSGWTKGEYARDKDGNPCNWDAPEAIKFCLLGAAYRAMGRESDTEEAIYLLRKQLGDGADLVQWNDADNRMQIDVLLLIDAAIRAAERSESNDRPM